MSAVAEPPTGIESERPPIRALSGRPRFKVTVVFPDKDTVQRNLSGNIAQHVANGFMRVMISQKGDGDDDILQVKVERES